MFMSGALTLGVTGYLVRKLGGDRTYEIKERAALHKPVDRMGGMCVVTVWVALQ
jgi:hypothetical protein